MRRNWHSDSSHLNIVTVHDWGDLPPPWVAVETADAWKPLTEEHEALCFKTRIRVLVDAAGGPQNSALYSAIHGNFPPEAVWVAEPADGPTGILGR